MNDFQIVTRRKFGKKIRNKSLKPSLQGSNSEENINTDELLRYVKTTQGVVIPYFLLI